MTEPLLSIKGLTKDFHLSEGFFLKRNASRIRAVDDVDLTLARGETLGLVGESGCGKSTMSRIIMRLLAPSSGTVRFEGRDVLALDRAGMKWFRSSVQMVFQDPFSSLNPRRSIADSIAYPMVVMEGGRTARYTDRVMELLSLVGLRPEQANRFPHQFSGGQRQRIGIARALAVKPKLIILDEPVSALDLSVQAQILNLLKDLQKRFDLGYLFVSHDLSVVEYLSDRVAVMKDGEIVEEGFADDIFRGARHPYTRRLLESAL